MAAALIDLKYASVNGGSTQRSSIKYALGAAHCPHSGALMQALATEVPNIKPAIKIQYQDGRILDAVASL